MTKDQSCQGAIHCPTHPTPRFSSRTSCTEPYTPIEPFEVLSARLGRSPEQIVKLDANENPYGPHPAVRTRWRPTRSRTSTPTRSSARCARRWPSTGRARRPHPPRPRRGRADRPALPPVLGPGDAIINCPPTFGMYELRRGPGGRPRDWSGGAAGGFSPSTRPPNTTNSKWQMADRGLTAVRTTTRPPKLLFLTSPNNPDGSLLEPDDLRRLLTCP